MEKIFGRYKILGELGRGGMATVYHAYDPNFDREVAVKVLPRQFLNDPTFLSRFEREAKTIAALEHDAIVPVYDFGKEEGQPFLVMRYMAGESLLQRLKKGAMSVEEVVEIFSRIADALDKAHSEGVIHRDIKPENIMFDKDRMAFLTDFGIAKASKFTEKTLTGNAIIGTLPYMSPERFDPKVTLDGRTDIYSLGVILFEMLCGDLPFEADTVEQFLKMHMHDPVPNILEFNRGLPPGLQKVLETAMAKNILDRYKTAGELLRAISSTTSRAAAPPTERLQEKQPEPAAKPRKKLGTLLWQLLVIGLLALGFNGLFAQISSLRQENLGNNSSGVAATQNSTQVLAQNPTQNPTQNSAIEGATEETRAPTNLPEIAVATQPVDSEGFLGEIRNIDGLIVAMGSANLESGCGGTMDIEVTLTNQTTSPIVLGLSRSDITFLGDGDTKLSLHADLGAYTPRCFGSLNIETVAPGATQKFTLRTTSSLGSYTFVDVVFGEEAGRLAGETWRIDLVNVVDIEKVLFGETINIDGLEISVGGEDYFPGCGGTLDFQITMRNTSNQPVVLGLRSNNIELYGSDQDDLSVYADLGSLSADCYNGFTLETIGAGETVLIAVRTTSSLSGLSYVDIYFETENKLNGLQWRLILPR